MTVTYITPNDFFILSEQSSNTSDDFDHLVIRVNYQLYYALQQRKFGRYLVYVLGGVNILLTDSHLFS